MAKPGKKVVSPVKRAAQLVLKQACGKMMADEA